MYNCRICGKEIDGRTLDQAQLKGDKFCYCDDCESKPEDEIEIDGFFDYPG